MEFHLSWFLICPDAVRGRICVRLRNGRKSIGVYQGYLCVKETRKVLKKVHLLRNLMLDWQMHCLGSSSLLPSGKAMGLKGVFMLAHAKETLDNLDFSVFSTQ